MKLLKFLFLFAFIHGCSCAGVMAQNQKVGQYDKIQGIDWTQNLVVNPDASFSGTIGITKSGGTLNRTQGNPSYFDWLPSAQNQTLTWSIKPLPDNLRNQDCQVKIVYATTAGYNASASATYALLRGTDTMATGPLVLPDTTTAPPVSFNFPCASSSASTETIQVKWTGTVFQHLRFYFVYRGPATNIGIGNMPKISVKYVNNSGQSIPNNSGTTITGWTKKWDDYNYFNPSTGVFTAPRDSTINVCGSYLFDAAAVGDQKEYTMYAQQAGSASTGYYFGNYYSIASTTNAYVVGNTCQPVKVKSGDTLTIQAYQTSGGSRNLYNMGDRTWVSFTEIDSPSETAITPDHATASWSGTQNPSGNWTTSLTTMSDITGRVAAPAKLTSTNFVNPTQYSTAPGIVWVAPNTATYKVCFDDSANSSSVDFFLAMTDGANNQLSATKVVSSASWVPVTICGNVTATAGSSNTTKIRGFVGAAGTGYLAQYAGWTIDQVDGHMNVPLLVGSVTSDSQNAERVDRASFGGSTPGSSNCTSSPCTIWSQSGNWLSAPVRAYQGVYNITFTGFSDIPTCLCNAASYGNNPMHCDVASATKTTANVEVYDRAAGGYEDGAVTLICMGPR